MDTVGTDLLMERLPEAIREDAQTLGFSDGGCLFAVRSDLTLDGSPNETWLIVSRTEIVALSAGATGGAENRPMPISEIGKIRSFQTVGSAVLQVLHDGLYHDVVRYSNARRELFDRARQQIERLIAGEPVQPEALTRPSERLCADCGLPLPARGVPCPRCHARSGIFRRTLGLMRGYRHYVFMLLGMMIFGVLLDLVPPYLTRMLVDRVLLPQQHRNWLPWILLGLLCVAASRCLINVLIGRTSSGIGTRITRDLRRRLHERLVDLSVDYYDRHSAGSLMSRVLYDVDYFQGFVVQMAQGFLLNILLILGIGVMLFAMNARLAILVMLPVPIVVVSMTLFWRHIYPRYYKLWDSQSKMAQLLTGLLSGIRLVKSFGQEDRERRRFSDAAGYMRESRRSVEQSVASFFPVMAFVLGLGGLIVWYAGGRMVYERNPADPSAMTLGTLMAFFMYIGMFYAPINALGMFSNWVTGFLTAGQRVFEVLDAGSAVQEETDPTPAGEPRGSIEFRHVTFGYDPYDPILKDVSLRIEAGRSIGIVGKSGSGKTTLINLLCRFYDVQRGQVLVDGVDVREMASHELRRRVALVLQEPFLFRASIAENIAYGRPDAEPLAVMDAARAANAHGFIAEMPAAYDTNLGERGAGLSGGERQRVSIARALLCDPAILILDEATSSVDTESEQEIQKALAVLGKGRTTIAIAHRLSTLKNADRIYVIDDGRIVEQGTHEALMDAKGVYENLVRIQTELTRMEL